MWLGITVLDSIGYFNHHDFLLIGQWQPMWLNDFLQVKWLLSVRQNFEPSLPGSMLTWAHVHEQTHIHARIQAHYMLTENWRTKGLNKMDMKAEFSLPNEVQERDNCFTQSHVTCFR